MAMICVGKWYLHQPTHLISISNQCNSRKVLLEGIPLKTLLLESDDRTESDAELYTSKCWTGKCWLVLFRIRVRKTDREPWLHESDAVVLAMLMCIIYGDTHTSLLLNQYSHDPYVCQTHESIHKKINFRWTFSDKLYFITHVSMSETQYKLLKVRIFWSHHSLWLTDMRCSKLMSMWTLRFLTMCWWTPHSQAV